MEVKLKQLMDAKGVTKEELAAASGCSIHTIINIASRGHTPNLKIAYPIARRLGVSLEEIWPDLARPVQPIT